MKKIFNLFLITIIILDLFIPYGFSAKALTCTDYRVAVAKSDGSVADLSCQSDYNAAKTDMMNYASDANNVAVIYNNAGTIINARYAVVKFKPGISNALLYPSEVAASKYTYFHTSYGSDGAFIDYDPVSNRAKVKISGYAGWTSFSNIERIIPTSSINSSQVQIITSSLRVRSIPSTSGTILGYVYNGDLITYYEKTTAEGYTWYRISFNGQTGWIANDGTNLVEFNGVGLKTYYTAVDGTLRHYYAYQTGSTVAQSYISLGPAPSYINNNQNYYSFDGNYFYNNVNTMLGDYKNDVYTNAINANTPHYAYYMYLSTHSKTGYTANDFNQIIISKGYTRNKVDGVTYVVKNADGSFSYTSADRTSMSLMYGQGQNFVDVGNTYGVNGLMMFGTALNESGTGTSLIAFYKNNLFGLGAVDSDPVNSARSYSTVKDSIIDFAKFTGSNNSSYTNPSGTYFFGSHYGNKGSGMNVYYAADPYWGEKQASNSFRNDNTYGGQDYSANTLGITKRLDVPVYKDPITTGTVLYNLKNKNMSVNNMPLVVFDKVSTTENGQPINWYKVYTDTALDENRNIANVDYNFNYSYAYIKESDLYVLNNQPAITANNISIMQSDSVNLLSGVSATDTEDGNLTSKITYTGTYDVNVPGVYPITYTVIDDSGFGVSKTINLTVNPSLYPTISASNVEVSQYVSFNPLANVTANDYRDGDSTSRITILSNNVNTNVKGTYNVTYSITNSLNNTTTKIITVTVVDNAAPSIDVTNKIIKINDIFDPMSGVTASDKEDGTLTSAITITSNNVNAAVVGSYKIIYQVKDSVNNITTKEITVSVEDRNYIDKTGQFYFEKLNWNSTTNRLEIAGYLAITGVNNTSSTNIIYDLILKNNATGTDTVLGLDRWLNSHPSRSYSDGTYNYSETWFAGSVDLSSVAAGEYTMYVRARNGNYQSINLFRNVLGKDMTRKVVSSTGRGYLFRNNNYSSNYPIELFVSDSGLISSVTPSHSSNMFNSYKTLNFNNNTLNIVGTSFNINGDYSAAATVERYLILENKATHQRLTYNIGSFVGSEIPLNLSDGKSKVRGWFDTTGKIDISSIPVGNYLIYIRTKTGSIDDYGELNDIFLKSTSSYTATVNGKVYSVSLNTTQRFRLELNVVAQ